jgi:ubiquinone/menaquinone biosynthesis C-methylase UbiE
MSHPETAGTVHHSFQHAEDLDAESAFFVRFLDTLHRNPAIRRNHARIIELLDLRREAALLDVGCGSGNYLIDIAPLVTRAVGIDQSTALLGIANSRGRDAGVEIELHRADALAMPFASETFDAVRTERVLQYLPDPRAGLAEMIRVAKQGGRVVATELDWDTIVIDVGLGVERDVYRRVMDMTSDASGNGWMGRELERLFRDAGLQHIATEPFTVIFRDYDSVMVNLGGTQVTNTAAETGVVSRAEADAMLQAAEAARDSDRFFFAMTLFTCSGVKAA